MVLFMVIGEDLDLRILIGNDSFLICDDLV